MSKQALPIFFRPFCVYPKSPLKHSAYVRIRITDSRNSRIIVFYPTSAIMSLFLNIIMYPLDPQAKFDIDLLSEAAYLVRSMPVRKMTAYEMSHMKLVNDFVAELIRLAHCAIAKATMELEQGHQNTPTG